MYEGRALKRLIDTRWTGHHQATKVVLENFTEIVSVMKQVQEDSRNSLRLDGEDIATCIGILNVISNRKFVFFLVLMGELLSSLAMENNEILQAISNSVEMELEDLKPLEKLAIKLPAEHELKTAKKYLAKEKEDWENSANQETRFICSKHSTEYAKRSHTYITFMHTLKRLDVAQLYAKHRFLHCLELIYFREFR